MRPRTARPSLGIERPLGDDILSRQGSATANLRFVFIQLYIAVVRKVAQRRLQMLYTSDTQSLQAVEFGENSEVQPTLITLFCFFPHELVIGIITAHNETVSTIPNHENAISSLPIGEIEKQLLLHCCLVEVRHVNSFTISQLTWKFFPVRSATDTQQSNEPIAPFSLLRYIQQHNANHRTAVLQVNVCLHTPSKISCLKCVRLVTYGKWPCTLKDVLFFVLFLFF